MFASGPAFAFCNLIFEWLSDNSSVILLGNEVATKHCFQYIALLFGCCDSKMSVFSIEKNRNTDVNRTSTVRNFSKVLKRD